MRKLLLLVSIIFVLSLSSVYAVSCGDTITTDTVLDADLNCTLSQSWWGLKIGADNITLDGNGHFIERGGSLGGIYVYENSNVIIKNFSLITTKGFKAINIVLANNITVEYNTVAGMYGILLGSSNNNNLLYNHIFLAGWGGIEIWPGSSNNKLIGNIIINSYQGINVWGPSNNNILKNNTIAYNMWGSFGVTGIFLDDDSKNNTLIGNNVQNYSNGIKIVDNNTLIGNNVGVCIPTPPYYCSGILLYGSYNNLIGNIVQNNHQAISFFGYYSNLIGNNITGNIISNNELGIYVGGLYSSLKDNRIYNNFLNNTINVEMYNVVDFWNIEKTLGTNIIGGPYIGGNYWANPSGTGFSQICEDYNGDGICDSSYVMTDNNIDYLPLTKIKDSDGDGIIDSEDKCPNTVGQQLVYGCSCEQILKLKPGEDTATNREGCSKGLVEVFTKGIGWAKDLFG